MTEWKTLVSGIAFGESPRWHDGRLWFSDWVAQEIVAVDLEGTHEVIARVPFPSIPMCIDFLPDGRLLIVSTREKLLLRRESDGSMSTYADLNGLGGQGFNEVVVDGRGNAYVDWAGFDLMAGEKVSPGMIALVTPDGSARQVADGLAFPNGMVVTPDNSTLIVAESYGKKLTAFDISSDGSLTSRRVWAATLRARDAPSDVSPFPRRRDGLGCGSARLSGDVGCATGPTRSGTSNHVHHPGAQVVAWDGGVYGLALTHEPNPQVTTMLRGSSGSRMSDRLRRKHGTSLNARRLRSPIFSE